LRQQDFLRLLYHNFRPFSTALCEHGDGFLRRLFFAYCVSDFEWWGEVKAASISAHRFGV